MSDPEHAVRLEAFVSELLIVSWQRLYDAHCWTMGNNGIPDWGCEWSMRAGSIAEDIREATDLVGPVDPNCIGMSMLASGWFERAVNRIGLPDQPLPSAELLAVCNAYLDEQERRWTSR